MPLQRLVQFIFAFTLFTPVYASAQTPLASFSAEEALKALVSAPNRVGPAPTTPDGIPHQQHDQNAPTALQKQLTASMAEMPGIYMESTPFSLAGSIGWRINTEHANGPEAAFIRQTPEFAHQHRPSDGSLHLLLPNEIAAIVVQKGWGILHPITEAISGATSEYLMIYGPRNENELAVIWTISLISYYQATGAW